MRFPEPPTKIPCTQYKGIPPAGWKRFYWLICFHINMQAIIISKKSAFTKMTRAFSEFGLSAYWREVIVFPFAKPFLFSIAQEWFIHNVQGTHCGDGFISLFHIIRSFHAIDFQESPGSCTSFWVIDYTLCTNNSISIFKNGLLGGNILADADSCFGLF